MLYNGFKMIVVRLLLISVLLYNTEAYNIFDGEYAGATMINEINATIPVENKTMTNRKEIIDWYPDYASGLEEDKIPVPGNATTNWWSHGSDDHKKEPWDNESGYEKENNSTKIVEGYISNWFVEPVTTTRRPYYSNTHEEEDNDKNTTETSYNKTVVNYRHTTKIPYHSYRYNGRRTKGVQTSRSKYFYPTRYDQWRNRPRNLPTPAPYGYNDGTYDTGNHIKTTTKRYGYWYDQSWNRPRNLTAPAPDGYNVGTYNTGNYTVTTPKHYGYWYGQWWNTPRNLTTPAPYGHNHGTYDTGNYITNTDKNYNQVASVSPIDNRTNSSDRNVTNSQPSGRNAVNILISSSINANQSRINEPFTDFLKKISGHMLPSARYIAPNSNVTNLAVADGNGNSFFYAYNLVVG